MENALLSDGFCPFCKMKKSERNMYLNTDNLYECENCHLQIDSYNESILLIHPLKGKNKFKKEKLLINSKNLLDKVYARSILSEEDKIKFENKLRQDLKIKFDAIKDDLLYKLYIERNKKHILQKDKTILLRKENENASSSTQIFKTFVEQNRIRTNYSSEKYKLEFEYESSTQIFLNLYDPFYRFNNRINKLFNQIKNDLLFELTLISDKQFIDFCQTELIIKNETELQEMLLLIRD